MRQVFPSYFIPKQMTDWLTCLGRSCSDGQDLPPWPAVVLSDAHPPAFSGERGERPDLYDIEQWLGCYCWEKVEVTLWKKGISEVSAALGVSYLDLLNAVLIHELGHWFNHLAPVGNGELRWAPDAIERYSKCRRYDEVWAQIFVWRYGQDKDPGVLAVFEALERRQSAPYKAWRRLVSDADDPGDGPYRLKDLRKFASEDADENFREVLRSLERSREHGKEARFDTGCSETNMLDHLENRRSEQLKTILGETLEDDISNW
jgi:hypothetical protein